MKIKIFVTNLLFPVVFFLLVAKSTTAQTTFSLKLDKPAHAISPMLYGLMTEEINHAYDGGLYGELIKDRAFKDSLTLPSDWSLIKGELIKGKCH